MPSIAQQSSAMAIFHLVLVRVKQGADQEALQKVSLGLSTPDSHARSRYISKNCVANLTGRHSIGLFGCNGHEGDVRTPNDREAIHQVLRRR